MQLSEAIRLGAMLKPQATHFLLFEDRTCALGAACEAVSIRISEGQSCLNNATFKRWPILRMRVQSPVAQYCQRASVSIVIQSLNDTHRWTREQIADWVATVEPALSTTSNRTPDGDAVPVRPTAEMNVCSRQDVVLGRRWVGTDLSYQALAKKRTAQRGLMFHEQKVIA